MFAAKLAALAIVLVPFVLLPFAGGAVASFVIAQIEDAPVHYPSAWLLLRAIAGGWLILATWGALACCSACSPAAPRSRSASGSSTRS